MWTCRWVRRAAGAAVLSSVLGAAAVAGPLCDEYDPHSPALTGRVALGANDAVGHGSRQLRTFVETGSVGKVDVAAVSASPKGVRAVAATPEISRLSPRHGEQLKGIAIIVTLWDDYPRTSVVLTLRQVCAQHFRNTFLYD